MEASWARIEAWLRQHAPEGLAELRPPASNRHINSLEDTTGLRLPTEMERSYKVHDGSWGLWMFPYGGGTLATIQAIEGEWLRWREVAAEGWFEDRESEPEGPIKPVHWNRRWLPVTDAGSGNHFCVDLDPAPGGTVGQIIEFDHEVGPVRVVASGFGEWLARYASALESGRYAYHPTDGIIDTQEAEPGAAADGGGM